MTGRRAGGLAQRQGGALHPVTLRRRREEGSEGGPGRCGSLPTCSSSWGSTRRWRAWILTGWVTLMAAPGALRTPEGLRVRTACPQTPPRVIPPAAPTGLEVVPQRLLLATATPWPQAQDRAPQSQCPHSLRAGSLGALGSGLVGGSPARGASTLPPRSPVDPGPLARRETPTFPGPVPVAGTSSHLQMEKLRQGVLTFDSQTSAWGSGGGKKP